MYYKQVIIKSEEDLPKEDGVYFCFGQDSDLDDDAGEVIIGEFVKDNSESVLEWLDYCKWYLIPISDEDVVEEITSKWNAEQSSLLQELP